MQTTGVFNSHWSARFLFATGPLKILTCFLPTSRGTPAVATRKADGVTSEIKTLNCNSVKCQWRRVLAAS